MTKNSLISLVHTHNYPTHHFLTVCVVLSDAVIHLPENVLTITRVYHYQKFAKNKVSRGLRRTQINICKTFLSCKQRLNWILKDFCAKYSKLFWRQFKKNCQDLNLKKIGEEARVITWNIEEKLNENIWIWISFITIE